MRKLILYISVTLDGYIARKNFSVDFLSTFENAEEDYGYKDFMLSIDAVIMGNSTYEQVLTYGEFPYKDKNCYVCSRTKTGKDKNVSYLNNNLVSFINDLKKKEGNNIWLVGGAEIIDLCLDNNLIDELMIFNVPIIIGSGIRLFKNNKDLNNDYHDKKLFLMETKKYRSGIILMKYAFNPASV